MSSIPLDLQRRFEQRWAAGYFSPVASAAPPKFRLERPRQQLAVPAKAKEKPDGVNLRANRRARTRVCSPPRGIHAP
jgi:hypothetical protein